jgi:hypothetical protein
MLRRSTLWRVGLLDPRINYMGDFAYWNRAALSTGMAIVDRPLIGYRRHANSVTSRESFGMVRVDEPFAIADDATLGAWFPGEAWRRRMAWRLMTVNATTSYALSMLLRSPLGGIRALWRVLLCGGVLAVPLTLPMAVWAAIRSGMLRRGPLWPFRIEALTRLVRVEAARDARSIVDLLSDRGFRDRLAVEDGAHLSGRPPVRP